MVGGRTPDLNVDVGDGLAGVDVDDLRVHAHEEALLILDVVIADELAADICHAVSNSPPIPGCSRSISRTVGALGGLGAEHAGVDALEQLRRVRVHGVFLRRLVVDPEEVVNLALCRNTLSADALT